MGKSPRRVSPLEQAAIATAVPDTDDPPYAFTSPESSTIIEATYDPSTETLLVTFRHNNSTYAYARVPERLWVEWLHATSRGKFFAEHIRPLYVGTKRQS